MAGYDRYGEADLYPDGRQGQEVGVGVGGNGSEQTNRQSEYGNSTWPPPPPQDASGSGANIAEWENGSNHHPERGSRDHRDKYRSQDRERYRDRDDKDYGRERRERSEKGSDRDHYRRRERSRERSRGHESERDHERERRHRHRSHSRSRGRSRGHSRSRSRDRDHKSKRVSGFDMPPPGAVLPGASFPGQVAGMTQAVPTVLPGMLPFVGAQLGLMPMPAMTQQATRHARKVYVGGLPPLVNEQTIASFFSQAMAAIGGNTAGPGDAVVNVYINREKNFAFVEMRSVEEASNAMALDGIMFEGMPVRVRRPSDYNPPLAATLGPTQPSPYLNLAAVELSPGSAGGADPDRVFVGGLPYYLTEAQIKELLESFGPLRRFDLVKDRETGNSKGYGFCFYQDPAVTDIACAALNGLKMGEKTLTVRRATVNTQQKTDQSGVLEQAQQQIALQKLALQVGVGGCFTGLSMGLMTTGMDGTVSTEPATKVLCLKQVVSPDELKNDDDYEDIYCDMKDECGKYGSIMNLVIPRPQPNGDHVPGLGKVFVEYTDKEGATRAKTSLNGRKFGGNAVAAAFFPEDSFSRGEYDS